MPPVDDLPRTYVSWSPSCDLYAFWSAPNPADLADGWDSNYSVILADTNETWCVHTRRGLIELLDSLVQAGYRIPGFADLISQIEEEPERCRRKGLQADPPRIERGNTTAAGLWRDSGMDWKVYRQALRAAGWLGPGDGDAPRLLGVEAERLVDDLVSAAHGVRERAERSPEPLASMLGREADVLEAVIRYVTVGDRDRWLEEIG